MSQAYYARFFAALYLSEGWHTWFAERVDLPPRRRLFARPAPPPDGERAGLIAALAGMHPSPAECHAARDTLEADGKAQQALSLDLLERLSKTIINLGYSTPEGGMEHFGARIESQLYNLCWGVDGILAQQVAVPAGWALVPIEPTEEMIVALMCTGLRHAEYKHGCDPTIAHMAQGYTAMLAAAQGAKLVTKPDSRPTDWSAI